jgi:alpha/beta superfamily hydrolase
VAVVAHPHPKFGGTMHNPVVFHADRELNRAGCTTLRFNFRSVGESAGLHDEGAGEVDDLGAAATWLRGLARDRPLLLVGYSFGAWCALRHAAKNRHVAAVVALGLPLEIYGSEAFETLGRPLAVVQGSRDALGDPVAIAPLLERLSPACRLHVIEGADHLFRGRAREAGAAAAAAAIALLDG